METQEATDNCKNYQRFILSSSDWVLLIYTTSSSSKSCETVLLNGSNEQRRWGFFSGVQRLRIMATVKSSLAVSWSRCETDDAPELRNNFLTQQSFTSNNVESLPQKKIMIRLKWNHVSILRSEIKEIHVAINRSCQRTKFNLLG